MSLLLLLACTEPVDSGSPPAEAPYVGDTAPAFPAPTLTPELDLPGVEAAFDNATAHGLLWPLELHAWFEGMMDDTQLRRGNCPSRVPSAIEPFEWTSYWSGPCEGLHYRIDGDWIAYVFRSPVGEGEVFKAVDLWSLTGIVMETKAPLFAGGNAALEWSGDPSGATFALFYGGQYHDPLWREPISLGVEGGVTIKGTVTAEGDLDATLTGAAMGGGDSVEFRDVTLTDSVAGSGTVAVRDPSSGWWELVLQADGCADVRWAGESLGPTCVTQALGPRLRDPAVASLSAPP